MVQQQYKLDDIPSLFVATKSDLDLAQQVRPSLALLCPCLSPSPAPVVTSPLSLDKTEQRHEVQPDTYCRKLSVRVPLAVSVKRGELADLFHTIVRIAIHPRVSVCWSLALSRSTDCPVRAGFPPFPMPPRERPRPCSGSPSPRPSSS